VFILGYPRSDKRFFFFGQYLASLLETFLRIYFYRFAYLDYEHRSLVLTVT